MPITHHGFDIQLFNTYGVKPLGEIGCQFMQGIISDISYSGVNTAYFSFGLQPISGTLLLSTQAQGEATKSIQQTFMRLGSFYLNHLSATRETVPDMILPANLTCSRIRTHPSPAMRLRLSFTVN
jgi:hypothetical protein